MAHIAFNFALRNPSQEESDYGNNIYITKKQRIMNEGWLSVLPAEVERFFGVPIGILWLDILIYMLLVCLYIGGQIYTYRNLRNYRNKKKNAMKKKDSESCNGSNDMVFKLLVLLLDLFVWIPPMTIVCYLLIYDYPTWLNDILGEYATTVLIWHEHIMDSGTGTAFLIALKVYLYASLIAGMPFIIIGAIVELLQNYSWRRRTNKKSDNRNA